MLNKTMEHTQNSIYTFLADTKRICFSDGESQYNTINAEENIYYNLHTKEVVFGNMNKSVDIEELRDAFDKGKSYFSLYFHELCKAF